MSKWEVGIYSYAYTQSLTIRGNEELQVCEDGDDYTRYFYIDSKCFNTISPNNIREATSIIEGLTLIANGAFLLCYSHINKYIHIDFSNIYYDGTKVNFTDIDVTPSMNPFINIKPRFRTNIDLNLSKPFDLIELSRRHKEIREILFQIGCFIDNPNINRNISTWTILYAIYDSIIFYMKEKYSLKNQKQVFEKLGITKAESSRFTGTANNYDYLGILSRHGKLEGDIPSKIMSMDEAYTFIFNNVKKFFAFYLTNNEEM